MKLMVGILIAAFFFAAGWFAHEHHDQLFSFFENRDVELVSGDEASQEVDEGGTLCAQVITPAINPETKEIREFPTPCDVPEGWDVIQNDIPGMDLEVQ